MDTNRKLIRFVDHWEPRKKAVNMVDDSCSAWSKGDKADLMEGLVELGVFRLGDRFVEDLCIRL